jgi:transcriptional regulator with XRE-family HTH domain
LPHAVLSLRQKLNLNQSEFGAKLGVTAMSVSRWEAGTNEPPAECNVKMARFLKDFGYDPDLLISEEIDDKAVVGLTGVVKLAHRNGTDGHSYPILEAFAPAERWAERKDEDFPAHDDQEVA